MPSPDRRVHPDGDPHDSPIDQERSRAPDCRRPAACLDDVARDVTRDDRAGDVERPNRGLRTRRAMIGAAALAVLAALGVAALQLTGGDSQGPESGYVDARSDPAPGAERRERLAEPFVSLILPGLVSYAGTGETDLFLVERAPPDVTGELVAAGWEEGDGVLVPGDGLSKVDRRVAPYVEVREEDGLTLVAISRRRGKLPGQVSRASTLPAPATRLLDLGGAVGVSFGADLGPCAMLTASLSSPTSATVLIWPPSGAAPDEVTADRPRVPDAFERIVGVGPDGDLVRVEVAMEDAGALLVLLRRLGLPGTAFCSCLRRPRGQLLETTGTRHEQTVDHQPIGVEARQDILASARPPGPTGSRTTPVGHMPSPVGALQRGLLEPRQPLLHLRRLRCSDPSQRLWCATSAHMASASAGSSSKKPNRIRETGRCSRISSRGSGSISRRVAARRNPPVITSLGSSSSPVTSPTMVTARSGSPWG